jgi:hypoxia up-regulated 1
MLSVSQEVSIYFENFWNEKDLKVRVTTDQLNEECSDHFEKIRNFLDKFKQQIVNKNLNFDDIKQIQLIGGGVRVPGVRKVIEDSWKQHGLELSNHLNGDEAMALGANYMAAKFTGNFQAKPIVINDGPGYNVNLKIKFINSKDDENEYQKEGALFERKTSKYGLKKIISVTNVSGDFIVRVQTDDEDNFWVDYKVEGYAKVAKISEKRNIIQAKTNLYFELDHFGIPRLNKAEMHMKENYWEEVKEDKKGKKAEDKSEKKKEKKKELKSRAFAVVLEVSEIDKSLKTLIDYPEEWRKSLRLLSVYKQEEAERQKVLNIQNELESAIYEIKEILENKQEKSKFLTNDEKKDFKEFTLNLEKFLFEKNPTKEELIQKHVELKKIRNGFDIRYNEWVNRDRLFEKILVNFSKMQNDVVRIHKSNDNLPDYKVAEVQEKIETSRLWLIGVQKRLNEQELFVNPLITKSEIKERNQRMANLVKKLKNYKKPKNRRRYKNSKNKNLREKVTKDLNMDSDIIKEMSKKNMDKHMKDLAGEKESSSQTDTKKDLETDL